MLDRLKLTYNSFVGDSFKAWLDNIIAAASNAAAMSALRALHKGNYVKIPSVPAPHDSSNSGETEVGELQPFMRM